MTRWLLPLLAVVIALSASPVAAQMGCNSYDSMTRQLKTKYGEVRQGRGLAGPAAIFELWASDILPYTWTILKVYPNGAACLVAAGDYWRDDPPEIPGDPA